MTHDGPGTFFAALAYRSRIVSGNVGSRNFDFPVCPSFCYTSARLFDAAFVDWSSKDLKAAQRDLEPGK